jgi:hypothetical protein
MKNTSFKIFLAAIASVPFVVNAETPVAYWAFEGNANDSAGSANGTLSGTTGFAANAPGALGHSTQSFQINSGGANDGFMAADPGATINVSGSYTVSLWANVDTVTGSQTFFSTRSGSDQSFDAKLTNGNLIHGDIGNGGAWIDTTSDANFTYGAGTWNHIAYVVNPDGYKVFTNGLETSSEAFATPQNPLLFDATHQLNVGRYNGGSEYFHGFLDDIAVYNVALSPQQLNNLTQGANPGTLSSTVAGRNHHGAIGYDPITNDADSGISASKTYTHALDFGSSGTATVNGVAFQQGIGGAGAENQNYAVTIPSSHPGNGTHQTTGDVAGVFQDMVFNNADGVVSLGGLTPGQAYETKIYVRNWANDATDETSNRTQVIEFDTDGDGVAERTVRLNPDDARAKGALFSDEHQAFALTYTFVADSEVLRINTNQVGGGSFHLYGASNEETNHYPIDTIFSTGMDANGNPLAPGTADPHYILTSSPGGAFTEALAITNHPAWAPNDENSQFVSVVNPGATDIPVGEYVFETSFDLTGFDTSTVEINISMFVDNQASIFLNGVNTGLTHDQFSLFSPGILTLTDGLGGSSFIEGLNTLEFRVQNLVSAGPGGFMAELNGTGEQIPEPGQMTLVLLALAGFAFRRKRA